MMNLKKESIDSVEITHQYPVLNGIRYHYAETGNGPLVIMLHGNLELWYSWRHQFATLAEVGYHAVAPDLRGFGESEVTEKVEDYSLLSHAKDVKALIDHIGTKEAVVIGHDWGANLMWIMPMLYPETVQAVVSLSIPFYPEPRDPAQIRAWSKDKFNVKFGSLDPMKNALPNLRKAVVLPGCGHWVQQERAEEVNKLIIEFLNQEIK